MSSSVVREIKSNPLLPQQQEHPAIKRVRDCMVEVVNKVLGKIVGSHDLNLKELAEVVVTTKAPSEQPFSNNLANQLFGKMMKGIQVGLNTKASFVSILFENMATKTGNDAIRSEFVGVIALPRIQELYDELDRDYPKDLEKIILKL